MPKNKGKGGKARKRGCRVGGEGMQELEYKCDGQEYGQVLRMMGDGRLEAMCADGRQRLCHIRGKMRKRSWVCQGDIVLLGLRDYQDAKADVILKYSADEARMLQHYGELPPNMRVNDADVGNDLGNDENLDDIEFTDLASI